MNYFVIQVLTRGEEKYIRLAESLLRADLNARELRGTELVEPVGRLLWPRRRLTIRKQGIKSQSTAPIFPGYVFYECDRIAPEIYGVLRHTNGFIKFLKDNQNIEPLTGDDRALLLHFISFGEVVDKSTVVFDLNRRIRVISGPMKGLEGLITKVDKRKGRAKIRLSLYEQSFLIDFGFELLESAEGNDKGSS